MNPKSYTIFLKLIVAFVALSMLMNSCKEDEMQIPTASTQADFSYEVETIVVDAELGIENFRVTLTDNSLLATAVAWDFGNGETSTERNPVVTYTQPGQYTITLTAASANDLHYNNLSKSVTIALGKQQLYFEDFSGGVGMEDDTWLPEGWLAIDNDHDGFNWYFGERAGDGQLRSESFDGGGGVALTPDNWLILPDQSLADFGDGASITFRYITGITANTPVYKQEHYGIFISEGSTNPDDFVLLFEETFTQEQPNWEPVEREVDISAYVGKNVFIAIRHYNVSDMDRIFFSEVELYAIQ